uniref:Uncharacterized protein n=1 Tax=Arundo donax TaxID=35708 RepID=A0A0A9H5L8_ARUDO
MQPEQDRETVRTRSLLLFSQRGAHHHRLRANANLKGSNARTQSRSGITRTCTSSYRHKLTRGTRLISRGMCRRGRTRRCTRARCRRRAPRRRRTPGCRGCPGASPSSLSSRRRRRRRR